MMTNKDNHSLADGGIEGDDHTRQAQQRPATSDGLKLTGKDKAELLGLIEDYRDVRHIHYLKGAEP
jgi:hypothetical protein